MALGSLETNGGIDTVELVERARGGDKDAFGALVTRYEPMVFAAVRGVMRGIEENAPDMTQEVFLNAYLKIDQLAEPKAFSAWLRTMAKRMAINGLRKNRFVGAAFQQREDDSRDWIPDTLGLTPLEILVDREKESSVEAVVASMSKTHRRVVELFYGEDRSLKEIMGILSAEEGHDVPMGTVKRRLHDARKKIANAVDAD